MKAQNALFHQAKPNSRSPHRPANISEAQLATNDEICFLAA
jgi:hypothetical protein